MYTHMLLHLLNYDRENNNKIILCSATHHDVDIMITCSNCHNSNTHMNTHKETGKEDI